MKYPSSRLKALDMGAPFFFTGKPCPRGHVELRSTKKKGTCTKCISDMAEARRVDQAEEIQAKKRLDRKNNPEKYRIALSIKIRRNPIRYMLARSRHRAKCIGVRFNLVESDIQIPKRCPILGIRLRFSTLPLDPQSPSIDRINTKKGYTRDNIVVISNRANMLKKDASLDELMKLASFYSRWVKPDHSDLVAQHIHKPVVSQR